MSCAAINATCIEVDFTSTQTDFKVKLDGSQISSNVIDSANSKAVICDLSSGSTYNVDIITVNSQCESEAVSVTDCATGLYKVVLFFAVTSGTAVHLICCSQFCASFYPTFVSLRICW